MKCGNCHVFGVGAVKFRCLNCHVEIAAMVRQQEGYHGRQAKKGNADCARCHSEHYGEDFRIYKWPTSKEEFDHKETGYPLVGKHATLKCEQCHDPKHIDPAIRKLIKVKDLTRTFEGLHTPCLSCHEDHHAGQLGSDCEKCHTMDGWKPQKPFNHSATKFPLTGKHQTTECAKCHKPLATNAKVLQYKGVQFGACTACHQDPHHGSFPQRCETCHNTTAWKAVKMSGGFDHNTTTKFPLLGKHKEVACLKCHKDANFKTHLEFAKCMDCHKDQHHGQFLHRADGGECGSCHVVTGWKPSTFTLTSHQTTAYPLNGKHKDVQCAKCHPPAGLNTNYHPSSKACLDCHKDPHGGQFAGPPRGNRCEGCHTVEGFRPALFGIPEHQTARFTLKGAHAAVACEVCHQKDRDIEGGVVQYRFSNLKCDGCHKDPHQGDFPAVMTAKVSAGQSVCESCHSVTAWRDVKPFDHGTTGFALVGQHSTLGCFACHKPSDSAKPDPARPAIRLVAFKGAPERCEGCHEDIHRGQFRGRDGTVDCTKCHSSVRWTATLFDHETGTSFSLRGAHENVPCQMCHKAQPQPDGRMVIIFKGAPKECAACHR